MKSIYFILVMGLFIMLNNSYSQIRTTNVVPPEITVESVYDSTLNFPGINPELIIGQTLYLLPKYNSSGQIANYRRFRQNPTTEINMRRPQRTFYMYRDADKNVDFDREGSDPYAMMNSYIEVIDVIRDGDNTFLKLLDIDRNTQFYYIYPSNRDARSFEERNNQLPDVWPFIIVGFYDKLQKRLADNSFVLKNSRYTRLKKGQIERELLKDLNSGIDVEYYSGKVWNFVDLTIDEQYFHRLSLVLSDDNGQTIVVSLNYLGRLDIGLNVGIYELSEFNHYHDLYGDSILLALDGVIEVGFNRELVLLALRPDYNVLKSNTDVVNNVKYEQLFIGGDRYIYLEDGIVTSLQY